MPPSSSDKTEKPWERWTEEEWHYYQAALLGLNETDEQTLTIILYHLQDPPLSHEGIAEKMSMPEETIRACIAQFYEKIRQKSGTHFPGPEEERK